MHNGTLPTRGGSLASVAFGVDVSRVSFHVCVISRLKRRASLWPGVSAPSLVDGRGEQQCSKEGGGERCLARGRARYWVGENVTDLLCERP